MLLEFPATRESAASCASVAFGERSTDSHDSYLPLAASFDHLTAADVVRMPRMQGVLRVPAKTFKWFSWRRHTSTHVDCWVSFDGYTLQWFLSCGRGVYKSTPRGSVTLASSSARFQLQDLAPEYSFALVDLSSSPTPTRHVFSAGNASAKRAWLDALGGALVVHNWYASFEVGPVLGRGGSSHVALVTEKATGATYALKSIDTRRHADVAANEIAAMKRLPPSRHVTQLLQVIHDTYAIGLVMSYHRGGHLGDRIGAAGRLDAASSASREAAASRLGRTLLTTLGQLHSVGLVHLDVKPANILFHRPGDDASTMILADFGFAHWTRDDETEDDLTASTRGTVGYMAPELVEYQFGSTASASPPPPLAPAADVFSAGVVLFHMLFGFAPFQGTTPDSIVRRVLNGHMTRPASLWHLVSPDAQAVLETMLARDPTERATVETLLAHRWFVPHDDKS
ncbi:Aste57867_8675 [Aphanomyces stellatus]|uniref:Aste57867_8675 protein n=1 Tax=Aphanomyces stellatus TaxID=120398 RepID=A0A485KKX3_9STRA|nr:hypothetical protein As57867_008641 [Aphanomyces stellatus]VFT85561.1 Aste57867_8675 [Aphanomyces stellatus]